VTSSQPGQPEPTVPSASQYAAARPPTPARPCTGSWQVKVHDPTTSWPAMTAGFCSAKDGPRSVTPAPLPGCPTDHERAAVPNWPPHPAAPPAKSS